MTGRTGITRREQFEAIVPYLHFLDKLPISHLWEVCNERGWFDLRRQYLDALVTVGRDAEYLHRANTFAALDDMAREENRWIDLWLAGFLETGISHEALFDILTTGFSSRKTISALELVANALIQTGRRSDLSILSAEKTMIVQAIVADATFAVRSLALAVYPMAASQISTVLMLSTAHRFNPGSAKGALYDLPALPDGLPTDEPRS